MGDMGDDFRAFKEAKAEQRLAIEPKRVAYALDQLAGLYAEIEDKGDMFLIHVSGGVIQYWPYTGWFCGKKPLGNIKGRGIANLKEYLIKLKVLPGRFGRKDGQSNINFFRY
jgi:hypothetical protein